MKKKQIMIITNVILLSALWSPSFALGSPVEVQALESAESIVEMSDRISPALHPFSRSRRQEFHLALRMEEDVPGNGQKKGLSSCPLENNPNIHRCEA